MCMVPQGQNLFNGTGLTCDAQLAHSKLMEQLHENAALTKGEFQNRSGAKLLG